MSLSTFKLDEKIVTKDHITRRYVAVPSATAGSGYPGAPGELVNFTAATDPKKLGRRLPPARTGALPTEDKITVVKMPAGFTAEIKQAAASPTLANFRMTIFNIATAAEHATADYAAGIAGKDIVFDVTTLRRHG